MSIRPATRKDIPSILHILTTAFWDEDAVGRFMHPHRDKYPNDVSKYWRGVVRESWWRGNHHWQIVIVDGEGVVVGFAGWVFVDGNPPTLYQTLLSLSLHTYTFLSTLLSPNRASSPKNLTAPSRALPFYTHKLPPPPRYDLETLAVHPAHQGRGYGGLLVQWGVDRAVGEGVPAAVVTAEGTEAFYGRWFGRRAGRVTEGVGNPLAGVRGGVVMVRDV